jgi:dienelactone hydrolase
MKRGVSMLQTHGHLAKRFACTDQKLRFSAESPEEVARWRRKTVRKLKALTGYDTMTRTSPKPRVTEERDFGEYRRQRLELYTEPDVLMSLYILIPNGKPLPRPAVIAPHGHGSGGKLAVAGCDEIPEVAETIRVHNYDYGRQLARAGFMVFCPDARGFGERRERDMAGNLMASSCLWLSNMAYPLGQTVAGMWTWDLHRLIDHIETRDDCLPGRIGCAGLSGGGLQTLWASALDERIRCAVISGYMYGYKESIFDMNCCQCNYVPHLYEHLDMGDMAALIAPRPLLVETGYHDGLNGASGLANVRSQLKTIRKAYRALDAPRMIAHDIFEGGHRWNGVRAIPWLKKHLMP